MEEDIGIVKELVAKLGSSWARYCQYILGFPPVSKLALKAKLLRDRSKSFARRDYSVRDDRCFRLNAGAIFPETQGNRDATAVAAVGHVCGEVWLAITCAGVGTLQAILRCSRCALFIARLAGASVINRSNGWRNIWVTQACARRSFDLFSLFFFFSRFSRTPARRYHRRCN